MVINYTLLMKHDFALSALVMLAQYHGISASATDIKHKFDPLNEGITAEAWLIAAREMGLKSPVRK